VLIEVMVEVPLIIATIYLGSGDGCRSLSKWRSGIDDS
jgi:hypothetical protein